MHQPKRSLDQPCAPLHQRAVFSTLFDECALAALSDAVAALRRADDPGAPEFEHAIRSLRVGILKHRAVHGAVGIDV